MASRAFWVWLHRWVGLAMVGFLVIVGLTGSVLAFREELDIWLNPDLLTVSLRNDAPLDPLVLREKAAGLYPNVKIDTAPLYLKSGRSYEISFQRRSEFGDETIQAYFNPYNGDKLGERLWGKASLAKEDIISFLTRLHVSLALPASTGSFGPYTLGVVALFWTIDCIVSFYLTFPITRREGGKGSGKSWFSRWVPAWLIKIGAGAYRINFDIHRAFGLWTWAMLFVFAWSSVGFNLDAVYKPTMETLFGKLDMQPELPTLGRPLDDPKLDWRAARNVGAALLSAHAAEHGYTLGKDEALSLDREHGAFTFYAHSSLDHGERVAGASVTFDAETGEMRAINWVGDPTTSTAATLTFWFSWLHMAGVFGLPMKIFVCVMGFVITALSVTGVYIWWKKRKARKRHAATVERAPAREAGAA